MIRHRRNGSGHGTSLGAVGDDVARALARRAAEVRIAPTPAARDAVDQRLRRRARTRRIRRSGLATAVAVGVVLAGVLTSQRDRQPDVASHPSADAADGAHPTTTVRLPDPEMSSEDPADLGLPRVVVDRALGLRTDTGSPPTARSRSPEVGPGHHVQLQVLRRPGQAVPVAYLPTDARDPGWPEPTNGGGSRSVRVNGMDATLHGSAPSWSKLSWQLPGGRAVDLWSYGLDAAAMIQLAEGVTYPDTGLGVYAFDQDALPDGFVETQVGNPEDSVAVEYTARVTSSADPDRSVTLDVLWEPALLRERRLATMLANAVATDAAELLEREALVAEHADGSWTAVVGPDPGRPDVAVALLVAGVSRAELDEVLAAVRIVDTPEEWQEHWR